MNRLLELQSCFSRSVIDNNDAINPWLTESETPALAIYSNAYQIRLQETLMQDYPALRQLLGDDAFNTLVSEFIREYPSVSFSLRNFGQLLPDFLSTQVHYRQQPYLAELAAFEWQLTDVFDVVDTPIATIEDMANIPPQAWPSLTVKLHTSIRWLTMKWNIGDIYPALKTNRTIPNLVELSSQTHYLIWRQNYSPHYRILDDQEWYALKILESNNFSKLCQSLSEISETPNSASLQAATYLKSWLIAGLIETVTYH
jgi:hypothetical protein